MRDAVRRRYGAMHEPGCNPQTGQIEAVPRQVEISSFSRGRARTIARILRPRRIHLQDRQGHERVRGGDLVQHFHLVAGLR